MLQLRPAVVELMAAVRALPPMSLNSVGAAARLTLPQTGYFNLGYDAAVRYKDSKALLAISCKPRNGCWATNGVKPCLFPESPVFPCVCRNAIRINMFLSSSVECAS